MNLQILFNGVFKGQDVDINDGYSQFMFNRFLCQIDDGKYAKEIIKIGMLGELTDEEQVNPELFPGSTGSWV